MKPGEHRETCSTQMPFTHTLLKSKLNNYINKVIQQGAAELPITHIFGFYTAGNIKRDYEEEQFIFLLTLFFACIKLYTIGDNKQKKNIVLLMMNKSS